MWQGFWIAYVRIPAFIVTLAGMLVFRGINNLILNGETIGLPQEYVIIASESIPDYFGQGGLHITSIVIGIISSILFVIVQANSRKNKRQYGFDLGSDTSFAVQMAVLVLIINLFTFWLALAEGVPYIVMIFSCANYHIFIRNKQNSDWSTYLCPWWQCKSR